MLNTLALFSSSRRNGNTGRFMDLIALQLGIEVVDLSSLQMSSYDYDHFNRNDDFEPLMERVLLALAELGLAIAPVPLTYAAIDKDLVGLGSFLVNAVADCDGCHNSGNLPNLNYTPGFNPYFSQHPAKIDPTGYRAGGEDFGQVAVDANFNPIGPHIISRNLTPDKTGRPEGGNTFGQFRQILWHGTDLDHLHPPCSTATLKSELSVRASRDKPRGRELASGHALADVQPHH